MHENRFDALPTTRQLDHLVFELLDPIHRLDDGARQRLLAAARHFRLGPGERLAPGEAAGLMLYLIQGQVERRLPGRLAERIDELHQGSATSLLPEQLSAAEQAEARIESLAGSEIIGFIGSSRAHWMPQFSAVPAFAKVTGATHSPELSRWLLSQGRQRILELESAFADAPPP